MSFNNSQFPCYLFSNVQGNPRNTTATFETPLQTPFDLPGQWQVAITDITYPHNWFTFKTSPVIEIYTEKLPTEEHDPTPEKLNLRETMKIVKNNLKHRETVTFEAGHYTIQDLINKLLKGLITVLGKNSNLEIIYNPNTRKVSFSSDQSVTLAVGDDDDILFRLFGIEFCKRLGALVFKLHKMGRLDHL